MSEYLSEEEQIARMKSWWDENGTFLVVTLVLCVAAVGGWQWYDSYNANRSVAAAEAYAAYQAAAPGAERDAAREQLLTEHKGTAYHVFVLFDQASRAAAEGDLNGAQSALAAAVEAADDDLLRDLAKLRLAKVQQGLDRSGDALATLASIRNPGYQAWALEAQGDIHAARGDMAAAHQAYEAAVQNLPPGDTRPVLDMKLKNAAPFDGEYVPQTDSLADALREAEQALGAEAVESLAEDAAGAVDAAQETVDAAIDAAADSAAAAADATAAPADDE